MRVLIAILSCHLYEDNGNNQASRDTWIPLIPLNVDYKFFFGQRPGVHDAALHILPKDVVKLNVPDDYQHVTYKAKAMQKWAYDHDYDFVFTCYPDTYVEPNRLLSSGFEKHDYSGNFCTFSGSTYCQGGAGYWKSKKSIKILLESPITEAGTLVRRPLRALNRAPRPEPTVSVYSWAEDKWAGEILAQHPEISKRHDSRYGVDVTGAGPQISNDMITLHLSRWYRDADSNHYDKQWMYDRHREWRGGLICFYQRDRCDRD